MIYYFNVFTIIVYLKGFLFRDEKILSTFLSFSLSFSLSFPREHNDEPFRVEVLVRIPGSIKDSNFDKLLKGGSGRSIRRWRTIAIVNRHSPFDWWTPGDRVNDRGEQGGGMMVAARGGYRTEQTGLAFRPGERGKKRAWDSPWGEPPRQMTGHKSTTVESVASTHFIKTNERSTSPSQPLRRPLIAPLNRRWIRVRPFRFHTLGEQNATAV